MYIIYELTGTQGNAVLIGTALFGLALMLLGCMLAYFVLHCREHFRSIPSVIFSFLVAVLIFGYGLFTVVCVVKDLHAGAITATMNGCTVISKSGMYGILSYHYYLEGTDRSGNAMRFPITFKGKEAMDGRTSVVVEYYDNIGRIVNIR